MIKKLKMRSQFSNFLRNMSRELSRGMEYASINKIHKTAGMIVIGDEILKGQVTDTNSPLSCQILHDLGVKMKKISVVGDDITAVSSEVSHFSSSYDYVITTGGIGPTHDDITFEGVAQAFSEPLVNNTEIQALCEKYNHQCSKIKLSRIPLSAKLKFYPELKFPRISVRNVFLFPGIPEFFQKAFLVVAKDSFQCSGRFYSKSVYLNATEEQILKDLNSLVALCPAVEFGSYPKINDECYKLKITIESSDEETTNKAYLKLLELVPKQVVVDIKL
ncbi:FAD synthase-like [Coccinella septempunctata]|uniref:FAD synthase-like n=1 Tax=Coccinella septempunctata TaxID=41139 RepID=UPI001D07BD68|nr:FAD synthase-like [Coccinella septempunctata]